MIFSSLAASVSAANEFVGPPVVGAVLMSAAAARITSFALLVVAVSVTGMVLMPEFAPGAISKGLEVATPENSLTLTAPLPDPL